MRRRRYVGHPLPARSVPAHHVRVFGSSCCASLKGVDERRDTAP